MALNTGGPHLRSLSAYRTVETSETPRPRITGTIMTSGRRSWMRDIARIVDGPGNLISTCPHIRTRPFRESRPALPGSSSPAVPCPWPKLQGRAAFARGGRVLERVDAQRGRLIPADVHLAPARSTDKSNERPHGHRGLLSHPADRPVPRMARVPVVAVAIPVTLALTLSAFYFLGYTLNRITLFALIFSSASWWTTRSWTSRTSSATCARRAGADAAHHDHHRGGQRGPSPIDPPHAGRDGGDPPDGAGPGLMGPYMGLIPVGASSAMFPLHDGGLRRDPCGRPLGSSRRPVPRLADDEETRMTRLYRRAMTFPRRPQPPVAVSRRRRPPAGRRHLLRPLGWVKVKMLPFDNRTSSRSSSTCPRVLPGADHRGCGEMAAAIAEFETVENVQVYAGLASPFFQRTGAPLPCEGASWRTCRST